MAHRRLSLRNGLLLIVIGLLANALTLHNQHYLISAQTCYTTAQVQSDSACLYILNGKVYEKGSHDRPHQGHACGSDVSSDLPASHASDIVSYLDPNFKGHICAAPTATPIPTTTTAPTPSNTPAPTNSASASTSTPTPASTTSPHATVTPIPTATATPTPSPLPAPTYPESAFVPLRGRTVSSESPTATPIPIRQANPLVTISQYVSYITLGILLLTGIVWIFTRLRKK